MVFKFTESIVYKGQIIKIFDGSSIHGISSKTDAWHTTYDQHVLLDPLLNLYYDNISWTEYSALVRFLRSYQVVLAAYNKYAPSGT